MIDSIKLFYPLNELPANYIDHFFTFKDTITSQKDTGERFYTAKIKSMNVSLSNYGLSITGSLSRFYYGSNQYTLSYININKAIIELSNIVGLDLLQAKVRRLDLAENIVTKNVPELYYDYFGNYSLKKYEQPNGFYYGNKSRSITFYDKKREVKEKRKDILCELFKHQHIIRIEYKFLKHDKLSNFLKVDTVLFSDVLNHFSQLVGEWESVYMGITKNTEIKDIPIESLPDQKDVDDYYRALGFTMSGGTVGLNRWIVHKKERKALSHPNVPTYMRKKYTKLMQNSNYASCSSLIEELDYKVKLTAAHVKAQCFKHTKA